MSKMCAFCVGKQVFKKKVELRETRAFNILKLTKSQQGWRRLLQQLPVESSC
ncbi:unnamed protein product [Tenebrio molitor]|nr:unnamed protein product [Tenebrio molitor]